MLYAADGRELGWCLMTLPLQRVVYVPAHNAYFAWSRERGRYEQIEPAVCSTVLPPGQTPPATATAADKAEPED